MVERKSVARFGALVFAMVLTVALSGCTKRLKGTIPVKGEKQIAFSAMAKISLGDAIKIAAQNYPGKPIMAQLENRDGFLVYSVEIVTSEKTVMDLIVDAGSGNILKTSLQKGGKY